MNKLIQCIFFIVISIIGIKSYSPSILSSYTYAGNGRSWIYTQVPLDTGKTTTNQEIPLPAGQNVLASLTLPDDNGDALILVSSGNLNLVNYNIKSNQINVKSELKDSIPYEYTLSPFGYDATNNIAYHSTLYWNTSQGYPTYLGIMIFNFATGYPGIVPLNVAQNLTSVVGTYNSEDQIYYAYYFDEFGNDHLVAFNTATNQSIDNQLNTTTIPTLNFPITQVFYYDGNVYLCKLFPRNGVYISRVDVIDNYTSYDFYSKFEIPFEDMVNPFVFDDNGCITILSPNGNHLHYIIINIQPWFITEGSTPTNQVPSDTWIINTI